MLSFKNFISLSESARKALFQGIYGSKSTAKGEQVKPHNQLHWLDMDDTLVHHDPEKGARVIVNSPSGSKKLSTSEYNSYKLGPNEKYDYSQFASSKVFADSSHPIRKMVNHAQRLLDNGHHVRIITARVDMEEHHALLDHLNKMGLDTGHENFHLVRAGNVGGPSTHSNKAFALEKVLSNLKSKGHDIKRVTGYDDHKANVTDIHSIPLDKKGTTLEQKHSGTSFNGVLATKTSPSTVRLSQVYPSKSE